MIDVKELRIGNLLTGSLTSNIVVVDWLVMKHIQDGGNIQLPPYDMRPVYEPIPLTEEWLIKLGYRYVYLSSAYHDKTHMITVVSLGFIFTPFCSTDEDCCIQITSVHQLQNIYYILTNKELTIQE